MSGLPSIYGLNALANLGVNQFAGYQTTSTQSSAQMLMQASRANNIDPYRAYHNVARDPLPERYQRIKRMADWLEAELEKDERP